MARLLTAPTLTYTMEAFLADAGPRRPVVAAALWSELPAVVNQVCVDPSYLKRVPAPWVAQVMACLGTDAAIAAANADKRVCVAAALRQYHQVVATTASPPGRDPAAEAYAALVAGLHAKVAAGQGADADDWVRYITQVAGLTRPDPVLSAAIVSLWQTSDPGGRRTALAIGAPGWLVADVLCAQRTWDVDECVLALDGVERLRTYHADDHLWRVVAAGPPTVTAAGMDAVRAYVQDVASISAEQSFMQNLLTTAAGEPCDFAALSRAAWGEHTAAVLVWAARTGPAVRDQAVVDHRAFSMGATSGSGMPERVSNTEHLQWALDAVAGDTEVRVCIGLHCRTGYDKALAVWCENATEAELQLWLAHRHEAGMDLSGDEIGIMAKSSSPHAAAAAFHLARRTPGLLAQALSYSRLGGNTVLIEVLGEAFGDDVERWRTALELAENDTTLDQIIGAVTAIHGPRS